MPELEIHEALTAYEASISGNSLSPHSIASLIGNNSVDVSVLVVSQIKPAAKHKDRVVYKVTKQDIFLPDSGETYVNMVKESATRLGSDPEKVAEFEPSESYFTHTKVYPLCEGKKDPDKKYLYGIAKGSSKPIYLLDGGVTDKDELVDILTPSVYEKHFGEKEKITENVTHDIKHDEKIRTYSLSNIMSMELLDT